MSYPACFVSWSSMKGEVGANPMWHATIILSVQKNADSPIQVIDSVGFYGITPCSDTNPLIRYLKKSAGLNIDLTGGYGELRHEEMRFIDKGEGLEGITFHVSKHQFQKLRETIQYNMAQQKDAINNALEAIVQEKLKSTDLIDEIKIKLAANNKDVNELSIKNHCLATTKTTVRPSEIYNLEQAWAKENRKPSRLKPFEFRTSWTPLSLITFSDSNTCKNVATDLLRNIQIPLTWQLEFGIRGIAASIPRLSGKANAEEIQLYSTGKYSKYTSKSSGDTIYFRKWQPKMKSDLPDKTRAFWSVPPNKIVADHTNPKISQEFIDNMLINPKVHFAMSRLMLQLQKTKEILVQSNTANQHEHIDALKVKLKTFIQSFNQPQRNKNHDYVAQVFEDANRLLKKISDVITKQTQSTKAIKLIDNSSNEIIHVTLELSNDEIIKLTKILKDSYQLPKLKVSPVTAPLVL